MRRFRIRRRRALLLALPVAALLTTASVSTGAEQRYATIKPGKDSVRFGKGVTLRGRFPDAPNAAVDIRHRRRGGDRFVHVTSTRTGDEGRFRVRVQPRRIGVWRAQLSDPQRYAASTPSSEFFNDGAGADTRTGSDRVLVRSVTSSRAADRHVLAGRGVRIRGRVLPRGPRRVIVRGGGERIRTRADRDGRFSVRWKPPGTGVYRVKVRAKGNRQAAGSRDRAGRVIAYRKAEASWYGPGFYGNRTACGQTLTTETLGVAHKTLPCGTKVHLRHDGREVAVRVIDRGPYVGDREFDLTERTKRRLGFGSTGTIWAAR